MSLVGIDRDGVKEDIFSYPVSQYLLYLRQPGRFQRARILASGINQVDRYDLALDQIVIKMDGLPVLRGQFDVGKVICAPAAVRRSWTTERSASAPASTNEIPMNRVRTFFCMIYSLCFPKA